jgi:hypothetical protein
VSTRRSRLNFFAALAIGIFSGTLCWIFLHHFGLGDADFYWSHQAARDLLAGKNPYNNQLPGLIPYPLPAAIVALPLAAFPEGVAAALFYGIGSGLLAFGLIRQHPERLFIFLAYPYWAALTTAQWTPLVMSAAFFPLGLIFCVAKPQIGTPVGLTHLSRKGMIAAAALLVSSFVLRPHWLSEWIPQLHGYQHYVALLVIPGPILLLALWCWRDPDAWLLLLCSIVPQRWFYDAFVLWLIPKTRRSILATVACSWGVGLWRWYHLPHTVQAVGRWSILGFYIPMLAVILFRSGRSDETNSAT